jgi:hypothetical protein
MEVKLNYRIEINGVAQAHRAGEWCGRNVADPDWGIEMPQIGQPVYIFKFQNSKDATLFSLKWSG